MSVQNSCLRGRQLSTSQIFEFLSVTFAVWSVIRIVEAGETITT